MIRHLIVLLLILSANGSMAAELATDTITEWVIVLDDPRPARLQGWQRKSYHGGNDYKSAIELERYGNKIAKTFNLILKDQWLIESLSVYCLVVSFSNDAEKTKARLKKAKGVQWIQPSNEFELLGAESASTSGNFANNLALPEHIDGRGVTIAVVDSAVDPLHQDIKSSISETGNFVITREGKAPKAERGETHGTAIAGVIVSKRSSKLGVAGVAPAAKVVAYRGCWEGSELDTHCNTLSLARALDAVTRSEADILNLSLSGPKDSLLDKIVERILRKNTIVVAAFDPKRPKAGRFPTPVEGVLVVRAEKLDDQYRGVFSAPGERVVASPGDRYDHMQGHSIATAYTSGLLALYKQAQNSDLVNANADGWSTLYAVPNAHQLLKQIRQYSSGSSDLSGLSDQVANQ